MSKSPAAVVASERRAGPKDGIVTLSTGVRARLRAVSPTLIYDVTRRIQDPAIPMQYIEDKGREEPNPTHPEYLREVERADRERGTAANDTLVMFGVELTDGLPEDDDWLMRLRWMEKHGHLDLSDYDLDDDIDLEFLYKRFIAVAGADMILVTKLAGLNMEEAELLLDRFQDHKTRDADPEYQDQE
jgi:hypothetical protein